MTFFTKQKQVILKFMWNHKDPKLPKLYWERKNKVGDIMFPNFRQYCKAIPGGSVVKNPPANTGDKVLSLNQEDPWKGKWQPTPVALPGKSP